MLSQRLLLCLLSIHSVSSFVVQPQARAASSLKVLDPSSFLFDAPTTQILATIDSDIASIPENEFTTVFLGGVLVMVGGLISTIFVGSVVNGRNLYANIVAESYAQKGDEEFWQNLSDEEKIKAQEMLARVKNSMDGKSNEPVAATTQVEDAPVTTTPKATAAAASSKPADMFSDYGD